MPHYEVIAIIHPDQHARAGEMAERYKKIVSDGGGIIHRFEDWGLRPLAYPMRKQRRAQYILLNIECPPETLGELQENFRFSDAVMRSMVVRCAGAISEQSPMMKKIKEEKIAAENKAANKDTAPEVAEEDDEAAAEVAKSAEIKAKKPAHKERLEQAQAAAEDDEGIKPVRKSKPRREADEDGE